MPNVIIASGPVIVEDGKVLLDISGDDLFWKFCGGRIKEAENLQQTAIRRVEEELGLEVEIINPVPYIMHTVKIIDNNEIDVLLAHFLAKRSGEVVPGDDVKEWRFIDFADLKNEKLAPNIMPTLRHFGFIK